MTTESGGLSQQEFLLVQEQLLQLRQENYELREGLKKKTAINSPKNEALQFASKLINRASSSSKNAEKEKDGEIEALRRKLETQEEEFRLQQSTLFEELKTLSTQNEALKSQISSYSDHPLEKEAGDVPSPKISENLEEKVKILEEEKELLCKGTIPELNKKIEILTDQVKMFETLNTELEDRVLYFKEQREAALTEKLELDAESLYLLEEIEQLRKEHTDIVEEIQIRNKEVIEENGVLKGEKTKLTEENSSLQKELTSKTEEISDLQVENQHLSQKFQENDGILQKFEKLQEEKLKNEEENEKLIIELNAQILALKSENAALSSEIARNSEESSKNQEKLVEDRILLLKTRYQLEVDDQKKSFAAEKEEFLKKITSLERQLNASEEEKKASLKKQKALVKELQKTLKEERKRADSYERKSEERAGWHVVPPENDRQSSHTFDGNESVSSLSAIESENVELITRLATLQKIHSENADTILQLESENSRLRREVTEKGELIESLIREKPLGAGFSSQPGYPANQPKLEVSFRKLLNTLGQDSSTSDVKEMNKKLQRMLEETLSKNIILQRDLQTLMERTGM